MRGLVERLLGETSLDLGDVGDIVVVIDVSDFGEVGGDVVVIGAVVAVGVVGAGAIDDELKWVAKSLTDVVNSCRGLIFLLIRTPSLAYRTGAVNLRPVVALRVLAMLLPDSGARCTSVILAKLKVEIFFRRFSVKIST